MAVISFRSGDEGDSGRKASSNQPIGGVRGESRVPSHASRLKRAVGGNQGVSFTGGADQPLLR